MEPCPYTLGTCDVMRTCPCCRRVVGHRGGLVNHRKACREPVDVEFAEYQHVHWQNNHSTRHERARKRLRRG